MTNKVNRAYTPHWVRLKDAGIIIVDITESNDPAVQKRLLRTLRKAIQKEKYNDTNFRALYANATLSSKAEGKRVTFTLDKGIQSNDNSLNKLFGDK